MSVSVGVSRSLSLSLSLRKTASIAAVLVFALGLGSARASWAEDDDEGPMSNLRFVIVKDFNNKPVRNAAVVLHPINKKGTQSKGGLELKTDGDGQTNIDGIPYGSLRIQVLAPGFQTFGQDYRIDKPELVITVRMKRPGQQYSSYENPSQGRKPDDTKAPQPAAGQKPQDSKPQ